MDGLPWLVGGDFNTFTSEEERQGGKKNRVRDMMEFADAISDCQLLDLPTDGSRFTWARGDLLERLDRALIGEGWTSVFTTTRVTNLPRIMSDHSPLLIRCHLPRARTRPPFRFQNMWVRHHTFLAKVERIWAENTESRGMVKLQLKLNRTKGGLKRWNKIVFGNIFEKLKDAEQEAKQAQSRFESAQSPQHRAEVNRTMAEYLLRLKMEEDYWRQKAAIRWTAEGERNTKFFQGWVRQKRTKAHIHAIEEGDRIITDEGELRQSAVDFFQELLSPEAVQLEEPDLDILASLPPCIDMDELGRTPTEQEVRDITFQISADSTPGPDGFSSLFFQHCWEIVGKDVTEAVEDFFNGTNMPRGLAATMIVLLPKKTNPEKWSEFRPISLCNVTNKIISKLLAARLAPLLPMLTSPNQSGFIKGRLTSDNVLLAKELFHEIWKDNPTPNLVLKLDMAKAYDRVQWPFLLKVLARMGFSEKWVNLMERCINPCWFSILINGTPAGFFKSSRGLRQGDPISPSLFILAAEYLSRSLDRLILGNKEMMYRTALHTFGVSHLAYADDIIIFSKARRASVRKLIKCLDHYTLVSGQKINADKSCFFIDEKHNDWADSIKEASGYQQGTMPFNYLGVPIYRGAKKTNLFLFIRDKIAARIHCWAHRHLSFGGRLTLIRSVLGAIPIHIFQVLEPTKEALKKIEQVLARYFWGSHNNENKTHWIKWKRVCLPTNEGGLGIRRLKDMVEAFGIKLWWRFREQGSLWAQYMLKKYCSSSYALVVSASTRYSPVWRRMFKAGRRCQEHIRWSIGQGKISFWDDTWIEDRPLHSLCTTNATLQFQRVEEFWSRGRWDEDALARLQEPHGIDGEIIEKITSIPINEDERDIPRWDLSSNGNFSITSAWELIRHREPHSEMHALIWNNCISPTISVFIWRLIANRIPVDAKLQWRQISLASKCHCCQKHDTETRLHLFVNGEAARNIWNHFARWFPNVPPLRTAGTTIETRFRWWQRHGHIQTKNHISVIIPCLILWFLWTERNGCVHHEKRFKTENVARRTVMYLKNLVLAGKIGPEQWKGCSPRVDFMKANVVGPRMRRVERVEWRPPDPPWIKLNTDGAWMETSNKAGGGGVVRDSRGDLLAAYSSPIDASSSLDAEMKALLMGISLAKEQGEHIWIELDAEALVKMVEARQQGSARLRHSMARILKCLRQIRFKITYIPREGNKVADFLAKAGLQEDSYSRYMGHTAPSYVKALVRMDQLGLPNFRFR